MYRTQETLEQMTYCLRDLKSRYENVAVDDKGHVFNTDLLEAREVGYLLDCAEATVAGALARTESRGATRARTTRSATTRTFSSTHSHIEAEGGPDIKYKPVTITKFEPKPRTY